ncbi:conserved Plasmodium protein, unknown function, partial [Plasmodium ovale curtisi]
ENKILKRSQDFYLKFINQLIRRLSRFIKLQFKRKLKENEEERTGEEAKRNGFLNILVNMDFNSRKKKKKNNNDLYNENINIYLEENDNYILDLEKKVQTLKLIGSNLRDEVRTSNSLLDNLSDRMENINKKITGVYRRVRNIIKKKVKE